MSPRVTAGTEMYPPVPAAPSAMTSPKQLVDFYLPEETLEADVGAAAVGDVGYGFFAVGDTSPSAVRSGSGYSSRRSTLSASTTEEEEEEEDRNHCHSGEDQTRGHIGAYALRFHPRPAAAAGRLVFASDLSTSEHRSIPIPKTQNLFSQDRELRKPLRTQDRAFTLGRMKRLHAGHVGPRDADAEEKRSFRAATTGWRGREDGAEHEADEDEERDDEESFRDADEGIFDMDL